MMNLYIVEHQVEFSGLQDIFEMFGADKRSDQIGFLNIFLYLAGVVIVNPIVFWLKSLRLKEMAMNEVEMAKSIYSHER